MNSVSPDIGKKAVELEGKSVPDNHYVRGDRGKGVLRSPFSQKKEPVHRRKK